MNRKFTKTEIEMTNNTIKLTEKQRNAMEVPWNMVNILDSENQRTAE